ncbi:GNAT family N-acetyltransferase [Microbacterium paraoxydans]|uniref:GNAT family N-acetyltransferase n=1 Tax=Microbacterium paraoxydans TaxID=199592 RepID=UPI003D7284C1
MIVHIREATARDLASLTAIELAADRLFIERFAAHDWPPPATESERNAHAGFILVAEVSHMPPANSGAGARSQTAGFAHVLDLDGDGHLEQLSVHPDLGRRGIGRRLLEAAVTESAQRSHRRITLRTYADVPWNAPFYAASGFVVSTPDTPFLESLVQVEQDLGLDRYGQRVQMTKRH